MGAPAEATARPTRPPSAATRQPSSARASAAATGEHFATPFTTRLPGSEHVAAAIDNLLHGRALRRDGGVRLADGLAILALALLATLAAGRRSVLLSLAVGLALAGAWVAAASAAFAAQAWLAVATPVLAVTGLDDARWAAVVAWSMAALMPPGAGAEALAVPGGGLRLAPGWQARAAAGGTYDALLARNFGAASPLRLPAGLDASWRDGGLLCPPGAE